MDSFHTTHRQSGIQGHSSSGTDIGPSMSTEEIRAHLARMFEDPVDLDPPLHRQR